MVEWHLLLRYWETIQRVENLVRLYESHPGAAGRGRRDVSTADILRAAVVLLYATVEEMCRTVEKHLLPFGSEEALNFVPLIGTATGRPEKYFLGRLAQYRGKKVEEVIRESVDAYLDSASYASVEEFCAFLKRVGLSSRHFQKHFKELASLMKRRHHIVHQADRNEGRGSGHHTARSLGRNQVRRWIKTVEGIYQGFQEAFSHDLPKYKRV